MSQPIRVLRVEFASGCGPYHFGVTAPYAGNMCGRRPGPNNDGLEDACVWDRDESRFGFRDFDQLLSWFNPDCDREELFEMINEGLGLAEYTAIKIMYGEKQVVFTPAVRLCWIPLSELIS